MGSTAPVKERRVVNDPKGLLGADFHQIPVLIMLDVIIRIASFVWCAMQSRWDRSVQHFLRGQCNTGESCCLMRVRLTWPRTLFLWSSHLTASILCGKNDLLPLFELRDVALRKNKTRKG